MNKKVLISILGLKVAISLLSTMTVNVHAMEAPKVPQLSSSKIAIGATKVTLEEGARASVPPEHNALDGARNAYREALQALGFGVACSGEVEMAEKYMMSLG